MTIVGCARFSKKNFSLISEMKRNWICFLCVSLVQLKNSVIFSAFFGFQFFALLQLSYFRFDAKQAKSCLFSKFSLPKRKLGRTLDQVMYPYLHWFWSAGSGSSLEVRSYAWNQCGPTTLYRTILKKYFNTHRCLDFPGVTWRGDRGRPSCASCATRPPSPSSSGIYSSPSPASTPWSSSPTRSAPSRISGEIWTVIKSGVLVRNPAPYFQNWSLCSFGFFVLLDSEKRCGGSGSVCFFAPWIPIR